MKKLSFYLLPAICLILYGCDLPKPNYKPTDWGDNYSISFSSIRLFVDNDYYTANGGVNFNPPLHQETPNDIFHHGSITDFCKVFTMPDYYNNPANFSGNSKIIATTTVVPYTYEPNGAENTKMYESCGNGLSSNVINGYMAKNRDIDKQTLDMTIISGPYLNSGNTQGYLYWYKTIVFGYDQNYAINNNIVQLGTFKSGAAAFKQIAPHIFVDKIYMQGLVVDYAMKMPNLATLEIIKQVSK